MPVKKRKTRSITEAEGTFTSIALSPVMSMKLHQILVPMILHRLVHQMLVILILVIYANSTDTYTEKVNERLKKVKADFIQQEI